MGMHLGLKKIRQDAMFSTCLSGVIHRIYGNLGAYVRCISSRMLSLPLLRSLLRKDSYQIHFLLIEILRAVLHFEHRFPTKAYSQTVPAISRRANLYQTTCVLRSLRWR